jgi:hypothetical protein
MQQRYFPQSVERRSAARIGPGRKTGESCPKNIPPSIRLRSFLGHHGALLSPDHKSVARPDDGFANVVHMWGLEKL